MTDAVAKQSATVSAMVAGSVKMRTLMGGTEAMRAAGETYLPKFSAESQKNYDARVKSSWLFNAFRKTVRDMTGRVFGKPVEPAETPPQQLLDWCENIDLAGRDLSTFARDVFEGGLSGPGISYIMVDAPRRGAVVTQAEAQAQNLRPFLTHLPVESVLGWRAETINNVMTLTQFRMMECVSEPDPADEFANTETDQVRVLDLLPNGVQTRIYRKAASGTASGDTWLLYDGPFLSPMTEITVVPFYACRAGFFTGEALLADLADINIAHWQSQSDQRHILHWARVPILFGTGLDDTTITIGGSSIVQGSVGATLGYVEHSGKAIDAGRQDIKDLEFQLETFGLQLLTPKQSQQSATGEVLDAAKETSTLAMTADALRDALEQALHWACQYGGLDYMPSVQMEDDFGTQPFTARDLLAMVQAVQAGTMSREAFIEAMQRLGFIRSDITVEDEMARIEADHMGTMPTLPGGMPNTGTGMVL